MNDEKKQSFQPSNVKSLAYINQARLAKVYNVTSKTIKRTLLSAQKLKDRLLTSTGDVIYVIEEKVVDFVNLLRNRTKPLPVTLSIIREYAEQVAKDLGEKDFHVPSVMLTIRKSRISLTYKTF